MRAQTLIETNRPMLQVRGNKTEKKKAGKGGLRCLWGKRLLINTYCISSPITSLASLIKKDAPFAPFHP